MSLRENTIAHTHVRIRVASDGRRKEDKIARETAYKTIISTRQFSLFILVINNMRLFTPESATIEA